MPMCSILQCSARKNKNRPQLTLHSLPKREKNKNKWLEIIGRENINPRHGKIFICSLHFEQSYFNKTLNIVRLRDDAVPSPFVVERRNSNKPVLIEQQNEQESFQAIETLSNIDHDHPVTKTTFVKAQDISTVERHTLCEKRRRQDAASTSDVSTFVMPSTSSAKPQDISTLERPAHFEKRRRPDLTFTSDMSTVTMPSTSSTKPQDISTLMPAHFEKHRRQDLTLTSDMSTDNLFSTSSAKPQDISTLERPAHFEKHRRQNLPFTSEMSTVTIPSTSSAKVQDLLSGLDVKTNIHLNKNTSCEKIHLQAKKINRLMMKCNKQKSIIKNLKAKVRRRDKKIAVLNDVLNELKNKNLINNEQSLLLEECAGPKDFLKRQVAKSKGLLIEKKYSETLRKFALTLHFFSPRAYDFIRKQYNTCLPHSRTLSKWYQNVNAEPGFTQEAFETLKTKVVQSMHPVVCALVMDEMSIRKGLTWDPKRLKFHGRVECGQYINTDSVDEASQCLVLLLTSINGSWKLPIGYFLITGLTGEQKSVLVQTAIQLSNDVGVQVVSLTCDGPASNFSMFASLGCDISKTQCRTKFQCDDSVVHVFLDPCHAIKLIRNTFGELRLFFDSQGRRIDFRFVELLLELQEKEGLHLGTKLSKAHISYQKQKMKVRLATQLLSSSVADAIEYCHSKLQLKEFEDCEGTINFINIINDVFDVLNSHSVRPPGWKKAMCPENIGLIRSLFESATDYLRTLKLSSGELLIQSRRKTGFLGLVIDMESALQLYDNLVEKQKVLKYIPLYKVSQDHLELFFSSIRARGGFNNNPNAVQFRAAYKKLLIRAEIREGGVGNCIPLEQVNILTCSSKTPVETINELTARNSFVEISEDRSDFHEGFVECLLSYEYTDRVLQYIAGFVARKLSRTIKCDLCLSVLFGDIDVNSLICQKSRGGLIYASNGVLDIIKKTENLIKPQLKEKKPENYYLHIFKLMMDFFSTENILCISNHTEHDTEHRLLLIKSIIKTYLDIRFRYYGKKSTDKVSYRNYFNKIILFRNE